MSAMVGERETIIGTQNYKPVYRAKGPVSEWKGLANGQKKLYSYDVTICFIPVTTTARSNHKNKRERAKNWRRKARPEPYLSLGTTGEVAC